MNIVDMDGKQRRQFYHSLANGGLSMPIGAHLILHSKPDHAERLLSAAGLGEVIVECAERFKTPLAFPLMDLAIEKEWMLSILGVTAESRDTWHVESAPTAQSLATLRDGLYSGNSARVEATCGALSYVRDSRAGLLPVGMAIGPFSLMTKLVADPITAIYLAGSGISGTDDEEVRTVEMALELGVEVIERSIELQVAAGARAICLCEPAANSVYLSPNQLASGSDIFERFVMAPNRRLRAKMAALDCDLIFHDCGEINEYMLQQFNTLEPAILSLGSSRELWRDASHVSADTVLFGNLPSKRFYSDAECPVALVEELALKLRREMAAEGRPFILGSECDVLAVPEAQEQIMSKVMEMLKH